MIWNTCPTRQNLASPKFSSDRATMPYGLETNYEIPNIAVRDPSKYCLLPWTILYNKILESNVAHLTENRKIKVLTIGAGVSGIMMAYKIQKLCKNVEHVIYEKNADIGGVWLQNRFVRSRIRISCHSS